MSIKKEDGKIWVRNFEIQVFGIQGGKVGWYGGYSIIKILLKILGNVWNLYKESICDVI